MTNDELMDAIGAVVRLLPDSVGDEYKLMQMHLRSLLEIQRARAMLKPCTKRQWFKGD